MNLMTAGTRSIAPIIRRLPQKIRVLATYQIARLDMSGEVETDVGGARMRLDLSDWVQRLYFMGEVEADKMERMRAVLPSDGVFLDVGANVGLHTCVMAAHLTGGKVLAYEPMPENLAQLRANIALNRFANVIVCPVGLSDSDGVIGLWVPGAHPGGPSSATQMTPTDNTWRMIGEAPVASLDDRFAEDRLDLLKIDVEGHEPRVLAGAERTIAKFRPVIVCEAWDAAADSTLRTYAAERDYRVEVINNNDLMLLP